MITLAIPIYYQHSAYLSYPHTPRHPATAAEYIALPPSTDPIIIARNSAIAKDAVAWGWHVYDVDETSPKMKDWWAQYEAAAKEESWDDDIWRIWQREHGVRIAGKNEEGIGGGTNNSSKMRVFTRGMKKVRNWVQNSRDAAESELRQYEERNKRLWEKRKRELQEKARKKGKSADEIQDDNASETSLPGSLMGKLEAWRGSDANRRCNPLKLSQHPWLSQR